MSATYTGPPEHHRAVSHAEAVRSFGWSTKVLIGLELFLAVGALVGAYAMFSEGDAAFGGVVTADDLPWRSWTIATMGLVISNAVVPIVVAMAAWDRQAWARQVGHLVVAAVLAGWILVEVAILGWISWMQPALLVYAGAIGLIALMERRTAP